jgi:hypothetical protein
MSTIMRTYGSAHRASSLNQARWIRFTRSVLVCVYDSDWREQAGTFLREGG